MSGAATPGGALRWRHLLGIGVGADVLVFSIWPIYSWVGGVRPFVLGMPFSMVWLCLMIAIVFSVSVVLFVKDREDDERLDREAAGTGD